MCARFFFLLLTSAAIGASLVATFSCQFFTYQALDGEVWEGLEGPYQNLPEASVGLFGFSESISPDDALGPACQRYNDWYNVGLGDAVQIAQVASLAAPILAFLAWVQILVEFLCCRVYGGLCCMSTLFFLAAGAQACTFLMFANTDFCLEPESVNECKFELGSFYSFGAMFAYFLLSALVSNTPASPGQRIEGCWVQTGWVVKDEEASPPREISTSDPENPRSLDVNKETQGKTADGVVGKEEIIVEEEEIMMDADGNQVVVEEEEIVEDADGNQVVVEEIVEGPDGEQMVVQEEVVEEGQPAAQGGDAPPTTMSEPAHPQAVSNA